MTATTIMYRVQFLAEYPMFGDLSGEEYAKVVLPQAKEIGLVQDIKFVYAFQGEFTTHVFFEFVMNVGVDMAISWAGLDDVMKNIGVNTANSIVNDGDAEIKAWRRIEF